MTKSKELMFNICRVLAQVRSNFVAESIQETL